VIDVDDEEVLTRGGVTHVVRVGNTVRRTVRPSTGTVHAYLAHLRSAGFDQAPEPLGYDEQGREVLSLVPGEVPDEPLPDWATTPEVLTALAKMIRRLHDASAGWDPGPDAVFYTPPGPRPPGVVSIVFTPELIAHSDYAPTNVVFRDGLPAAFIDFDQCRRTTRVLDLVNALGYWAPFAPAQDRPAVLRDADVLLRTRLFADAYGMDMDMAQREQVVPMALARTRNAMQAQEAAARADLAWRNAWEGGLRDEFPRAIAWLTDNADVITDTLLVEQAAAS